MPAAINSAAVILAGVKMFDNTVLIVVLFISGYLRVDRKYKPNQARNRTPNLTQREEFLL
jgi:hypothetical protein